MSMDDQYFTERTLTFFSDLKSNNNRDWFNANKLRYETDVLEPARIFTLALGDAIQPFAPMINADPRVNRSIFRIYRDIRFSKDKTPYKTHLGIWLWSGSEGKFEAPGYYFHLEDTMIILSAGLHGFSKRILNAYRNGVVHPERGKALRKIINEVEKKGVLSIGGKYFKRTPRGLDPNHPNADLLLHNGLTLGVELGVEDVLFSGNIIEICVEYYKQMAQMHDWLYELALGKI